MREGHMGNLAHFAHEWGFRFSDFLNPFHPSHVVSIGTDWPDEDINKVQLFLEDYSYNHIILLSTFT
jgi:hypothetical protein